MSQYWIKVMVVILPKIGIFLHRDTHCIRKLFLICVLAPIYDYRYFLFEVKSNNNDPMSQYWIKVTVVILPKIGIFLHRDTPLYKETIPNMCLAPIYDYRYFLFEVKSNNNDPMIQYWIKVTVVILPKIGIFPPQRYTL